MGGTCQWWSELFGYFQHKVEGRIWCSCSVWLESELIRSGWIHPGKIKTDGNWLCVVRFGLGRFWMVRAWSELGKFSLSTLGTSRKWSAVLGCVLDRIRNGQWWSSSVWVDSRLVRNV